MSTNTTYIPNAGDIVQCEGEHYRVEAFLKLKGDRYHYCPKEEATHLSLQGEKYCIGMVSKCTFIRLVKWHADEIEELKRNAERLGESGHVAF